MSHHLMIQLLWMCNFLLECSFNSLTIKLRLDNYSKYESY